jgi:hypothetical protein
VVLYGALALGMMAVRFAWILVVMQAWITLSSWVRTDANKNQRMKWMLTTADIVSRFYCVVLTAMIVPFFLAVFDKFSILFAANMLVGLIAMYATVLPPDDGERGKKAKLTHEKLVALFGTSWMPTPVPQPL